MHPAGALSRAELHLFDQQRDVDTEFSRSFDPAAGYRIPQTLQYTTELRTSQLAQFAHVVSLAPALRQIYWRLK